MPAAGSAPWSSPNSSPRATRSSAWRAPTPRRGPSPPPAPCCAATSTTPTAYAPAPPSPTGAIHLAFTNDFTDFANSVAAETRAVETFGAALEGSGKALVIASGTPAVPGRPATEHDPMPTDGPIGGRGRNAQTVLDLATRDVRSAVVRLPRSVHARGGPYGFASLLIEAARRTGVAGYVGDGTQRWPAVHRLDAARLFRLALEHATPGTVVHAVADEGDTMRAIAEAIGRQLGLPTAAVPAETFGFLGGIFGGIFGVDQPASSTLTRERFGWQPTRPSLLDDLEAGNYPA